MTEFARGEFIGRTHAFSTEVKDAIGDFVSPRVDGHWRDRVLLRAGQVPDRVDPVKWLLQQLDIFGQGCLIGLGLWLLIRLDFFIAQEVLPWVSSGLAPLFRW